MSRPGPLRELPLDQFIPQNPNISLKRPLDSSPASFSPAKRRILNEEGFYTPKNPLSRHTMFSDVLTGPSSPAKRLDFGSPKQTPSGSRFKPTVEEQDMSDLFSQPLSIASALPSTPSSSQTDPQSIHYPGFRVYFDPHIISPSSDASTPEVTANDQSTSAVKENIAPRRKSRKSAAVSSTEATTKRRESERLKAKTSPTTPKQSTMKAATSRRTIFGTSSPKLRGLESLPKLLRREVV